MTDATASKRVSWIEMFYDLVFVFAVTQIADFLADDVSWRGLLEAWVVFTPFWWSWVGTAILSNLTDLEDTWHRLNMFAIGLVTLLMTVAAPTAFSHNGVFFAASFVVLRLMLVSWSTGQFRGLHFNPFTASAFITAPLFLVTAFLPPEQKLAAWTVLMVVELSTSWLFRKRLKALRVDTSHLPERFGLVIMIALGESVIVAGQAVGDHFDAARIVSLATCFAFVCGLWWTYFNFSVKAVAYKLSSEDNQSRIIRAVLSYGHYALICAIIAIATGMRQVVAEPGARLPTAEVWLLCGGTALYLAAFAWQRWGTLWMLSAVRAPAAAVSLMLGLAGRQLSAVVLVLLLTAILAVLAAVELAALSADLLRPAAEPAMADRDASG
ncbi:low temperature requirement protein A [Actinoplanes sp. KI2]|uniref:low temperature requirement protein A n=1 Tax=Actinoplanes sp. KI2 TaxID=2983315 RepID=UPI0021D5E541|nr:low temperature requirement protein A [Actinoplanes sp. KI2]MCU7729573.1 low temperature requirement protein A [Actinoplanes sp. KI2]